MGPSFIVDDAKFPSFCRRDLYVISIAGIASTFLGLILTNPVYPTLDIAPLLNSVDIISMTFATGLFSFLTAGILFSSQASRQYFLRRLEKTSAKRVFWIRVLQVVVIASIFAIVLTFIAFLKPIILNAIAQYPISFSHFVFYPAVLGASLVVSAFLAILASSLAILTDDSRLCVVLGCLSTTLIAQVTGWSAERIAVRYSLVRNLALFSPHNLVRGLAVQMSGYQFESTNEMVRYTGFVVSVEGLAVSLMILGVISIMILFTFHRVLVKNTTRWPHLEGMVPNQEIWSSSATTEKLNRLKRGLRIQRIMTSIIIVILLVSVSFGVSAYATQLENITTIVHYKTPGTQETLQVGDWWIFDVDVQPPYPGLFNSLYFHIGIISWGNATDSLSFYYEILEMNSTEFGSLDESSRLEMVSSRLNTTFHGGEGYGRGKGLEESFGSYVCVLKVISDVDPSENSYIEVSLLIEQTGN